MNGYGWGGGRKEGVNNYPEKMVEIDGAGGLVLKCNDINGS